MSVEVKVPEVGESITEGLLVEWEKNDGDHVEMDDPLFVLETDKVTMTINAEQSGRLEVLVDAGETVKIGDTVARLKPDGQRKEDEKPEKTTGDEEAGPEKAAAPEEPSGEPEPSRDFILSPAARRLVQEEDLDPEKIQGSGRGGRVTKGDVLNYIEDAKARGERKQPGAPKERTGEGQRPKAVDSKPAQERAEEAGDRETRQVLSPLRKRIAQRLVEAQHTAAILTTFNEADMTNVTTWRAKYRESFQKEHGVDLGFMSFFVKACIVALQAVPQVNRRIEGDELVQNHYFDIGIAVSTDSGLVVPIIRDADRLSFAELEQEIAALAEKARKKALTLEELTGGCFTISNGGVFGSLLSTPILNPPQSAILGMHAIKKRPVAVGDQLEIRPMMYLALSYDHRVIDGRESVTFLKRIVECIEDPARMLLRV